MLFTTEISAGNRRSLSSISNSTNHSRNLVGCLVHSQRNSPFRRGSVAFFIDTPVFIFQRFVQRQVTSCGRRDNHCHRLQPIFCIPNPRHELIRRNGAKSCRFIRNAPRRCRITITRAGTTYRRTCTTCRTVLSTNVTQRITHAILPINACDSVCIAVGTHTLVGFLSLHAGHRSSTFPSFPRQRVRVITSQVRSC